MKKIHLCILYLLFVNVIFAQDKDCSGFFSDDTCLRYTASGCQKIINGNYSKARNESQKMANITAESELSKMINTAVTRVVEQMSEENDYYSDMYSDTTLISTYKIFKGMRTICQSESKQVDGSYVTYITKEISLDNISDMFYFENEHDKQKFRELLEKE